MGNNLQAIAKLLRYYSLVSTTEAGSGHPSSCLSAADLMAVLCFCGFYKFDLSNPDYENNDRLIFSKGHAAPLFYSIYAVAGKITEQEMLTLRKFGSRLEGHPTMEFPFTEVPTGSLGQGLSAGIGMAMNAKMDKLSYNTFVLLGDSEIAEGSVWEAAQVAAYYSLDNLYAIVDVNRLGQRGQTMYGHEVERIAGMFASFGWNTELIYKDQGMDRIVEAFDFSVNKKGKQVGPTAIIAQTLKGKGVSFMEDKDGWHGKALTREELSRALEELGPVDKSLVGEMAKPAKAENPKSKFQISNKIQNPKSKFTSYDPAKSVATRKAYGNALVNIIEAYPNAIILDAETSNSTYSEFVKKQHPEKFVECFIAEQNMVGMAMGLSKMGKIPFVSTFAAFLSRAFDQIRMSGLAQSNIKFCGSHAGVSIGEDGSSQMGLEEIAMFRTLLGSVVLYPSDAVSTEKLVWETAKHKGNVYIQTTRKEAPILYGPNEEFVIGGSKTLKTSGTDVATVIGAGITVHEALAAYEELKKEKINIRVIDLYSIKPLDLETLKKAAEETKNIITVEDNHHEGGIAEAVLYGLNELIGVSVKFKALAVKKMPRSGKPDELLAYEEINKEAIIKTVKGFII
ncbi:MAG: transketolase [Candidatus Doudnabacteria bacterium]|nr:transketolase [Candidatus Doudnabacteria bacterium]